MISDIQTHLKLSLAYNYFFGDNIKNILFPSSLGNSSTFAIFSRACANLSNRISPLSLKTIVLP